MRDKLLDGKPVFFLDMDGVVADFLTAATKLFNLWVPDLPLNEYRLDVLFNVTWAEIDRRIRAKPTFFYDIRPYPWAKDLVEFCQRRGELFILSSPWPQSSDSHSMKVAWCQRYLGLSPDRVIITPYKHLLSMPGRVLIDDLEPNCTQWSMMGGASALFPARHTDEIWTEEQKSNPVLYLFQALKKLEIHDNKQYVN